MMAWFDARRSQEFGVELAQFYMQRIPLGSDSTAKQFSVKTRDVLEKMGRKIDLFRQQNPLNIYKTARLGHSFKWSLKDAGYDDAYVNHLTQWLVTRLH